MGSELLNEIRRSMQGTIRENEPMAAHTSFGIGGPVDVWASPQDCDGLFRLLDLCETTKIPYKIIGRGTNMLVRDAGISGIVISLDKACQEMRIDAQVVKAGAAVSLNAAAKFAAAHGLKGLDFCIGIPGCVGGSLATNAGAWGQSLGDALASALIYDPRKKAARNVSRNEMKFDYRKSNISSFGVILEAEFKLTPDEPEAISARMKEYLAKRGASQPAGLKSAGCIFKNPPGGSAGAMIDALGFKGYSHGGAVVSDIHANFIVNKGSAKADDVFAIIDAIKKRVRDTTGVELEEEIEIIGRN